MKIFHFSDPLDHKYAYAVRQGTWSKEKGVCPECTAPLQSRIPPLIIQWEPYSDIIGDFIWPGTDDEVVVSNRVRLALKEQFPCRFAAIEMIQDPKVRKPKRITKRTKPRVWLPYEGSALWELIPIGKARLDREASNWILEKVCSTCGRQRFRGRHEGEHTVIDKKSWTGHEIFNLAERHWIYCTERVKEFIEANEFTNVSFLEDGWIPD
jgi:hypothetical protein